MAGTAGNNYITLRWLNRVGGYDYFTFTARHSYGYDVRSTGVIEKDIFRNWDTEFINGQTEREDLGVVVSPFIEVRSGLLTEAQAEAVARIKTSVKIQQVSDGQFTTVQITRDSFTYRTDKEKLITINFRITLPKLQTQTL